MTNCCSKLTLMTGEWYTLNMTPCNFSVTKQTDRCMKDADSYGKMFSLMPWVAKIFPNLSDYNKIKEANSVQYDFMKKLIDEQYDTYDENHVRHFLDVYFKEMKATQRSRHYRNADFHCMNVTPTNRNFFYENNFFFRRSAYFDLFRFLQSSHHIKHNGLVILFARTTFKPTDQGTGSSRNRSSSWSFAIACIG